MRVKTTKDLLKNLFQTLLVILLSTNMMGCSQGIVKRDTEIWLIDSNELNLFRILNSGKEQIIPLKSKSMDRFMCIDKEEAKGIVQQIIEGN